MMIGIAGKARSGKDTAALYLAQRFGLQVFAFATPIKDALRWMFHLTDAQLDGEEKEKVIDWLGCSPRELAQTLGTEWGRGMVRPDVWILALDRHLDLCKHQPQRNRARFVPCIKDVRFPEEQAYIRSRGGLVIHVERSQANVVREHVSETGLNVLPGDVLIKNEASISEFYLKLTDIVNDYLTTGGFYD